MSVLLVREVVGEICGEGGDRGREGSPFFGEGVGEADAVVGGAVELAGPGLVGVPLAREVSLLLESSQQRIQRVRIGREAAALELLEQSVAVARRAQELQAGQHDRAAPKLLQVRV